MTRPCTEIFLLSYTLTATYGLRQYVVFSWNFLTENMEEEGKFIPQLTLSLF